MEDDMNWEYEEDLSWDKFQDTADRCRRHERPFRHLPLQNPFLYPFRKWQIQEGLWRGIKQWQSTKHCHCLHGTSSLVGDKDKQAVMIPSGYGVYQGYDRQNTGYTQERGCQERTVMIMAGMVVRVSSKHLLTPSLVKYYARHVTCIISFSTQPCEVGTVTTVPTSHGVEKEIWALSNLLKVTW